MHRRLNLIAAFTGFMLSSNVSFAQQAKDPSSELQQDWPALMTAQKHVAEDLQALLAENQRLKQELEAAKKPASSDGTSAK